MNTPATCYRGGRIHTPADPHATAMMVTDGTVTWVGADADAPHAERTVDLDGALVTPAFVDAHVHLTDTGLAASGLDLTRTRSARDVLDQVASAAGSMPPDAVVLGHGWDDSTWHDPALPDADALERAAGGRLTYLTQASMHSALCSRALVAASDAEAAEGYDPGGWLRRDAHHTARQVAFGSINTMQRRQVQATALRRAAALGIAAVHECGGPGISSEEDFTGALALSGQGVPEVYGYWGELGAAAKARELGAVGAGGDLFADGALGSQTAHLRQPYLDTHGHGHGYLTSEQVRDHLLDCHERQVPGGFHAIGDRALQDVLAGFAAAAEKVGGERLRRARHRIEHAELVDRQMVARFVEWGIVASMQPAFDRLWGGEHQMYAQRLGATRALSANPFGAMHAVGVSLAFGSDAPVTPLDPWGSVRAAASHHNPAYRMELRAAFAAHTRGGWRAVGQDTHGVLVPGAPATFACWHTPAGRERTMPVLLAEDPGLRGPGDPTPLPVCRRTVLRGETIFDIDREVPAP